MGEFCIASSMYGCCGIVDEIADDVVDDGSARDGEEVIVKPPGFSEASVNVSTHCPGRKCMAGCDDDVVRCMIFMVGVAGVIFVILTAWRDYICQIRCIIRP